ncbi:DUF2283 domain-containing protein [Aquidulcibacter paucihalophilus]|uniref:DUF2283 domain-containing protein n=1 Tax=Aquidulcibacter paucihalophilus TaxID=1978549 RepID=UPI000A18EDFD|nr:DUF2283 domain-containing protein [Aquidulcibacter paucihalophilus]
MSDFDVAYDKNADVLYISTKLTGPSYTSEGEDGIVWSHQVADGRLVSMTVLNFNARWQSRLAQLTEQLTEQLYAPGPVGPMGHAGSAN